MSPFHKSFRQLIGSLVLVGTAGLFASTAVCAPLVSFNDTAASSFEGLLSDTAKEKVRKGDRFILDLLIHELLAIHRECPLK